MAAAKANGNGNGIGAAATGPVTVFVSGGTSNTGSATITALLRDHPNVTVRAGVRDPKKAAEKFPAADAKRLSFVVHDVKNAHLTAAQSDAADAAELKGVDALLLVPPQSFQDRRGVPTAYIRAAKAAGVKHIVLISTTASVRPDLYLTGPFAAIEAEVAASGVPYSHLRTGSFFENHWGNKDTIAPVDGSAAFYAPIAGDALVAAIAVADIGEAAANALVRPGASKAYNLGGTPVTHNELAAVYSRVLNKVVKFVSIPDDAFAQVLSKHGWPEASAKGLAALYRYYEAEYAAVKAKGAAAVAAYYSTADLSALLNGGRAPTSFGQWLVASGAAFAFGGVKQHVFVAGAAGNTGAATVKSLLRDHPHVTIRAGVRDVKKAEGVFAAEFADPKLRAKERLTFAVHDVKNAHLTAAQSDAADAAELKGVDALVLAPPAIPTERVGVATAYARASKAAGVKHILIITTPGAVLPLALTKTLGEAEQLFVASGVPYTLLRPVFFYTNYQLTADSIRAAGGSAWYIPAAADKPIFHIAIEDVGEAAANAATYGSDPKANHYGKAHALASHNLTGAQAAEAFSRVLGRKVSYVAVTDEQTVKALTAKGLPEFVAKGLVELYRTAETGAWGNGDAAVATLKALLNEQRNPTSLDAFVAANAKQFA